MIQTDELTQIESVLVAGDLARLNDDQRLEYYQRLCESLGLNPLTQPFQYLVLSGKLVLYATKSCTEQLRQLHGVSITGVTSAQVGDVYIVTATAQDRSGRTDCATGAVAIAGLEPDPSGAGDIHLAPRVKVGEVVRGPRRPVERLHVGDELDQIARHEPGRQPHVPQELHHQPGRIAARTGSAVERLFGCLNARLEANEIADAPLKPLREIDEGIDRAQSAERVEAVEVIVEKRRHRIRPTKRLKLVGLPVFVGEWEALDVGFEEEVERVVDRHLGDEIDFNSKLTDLFRKYEACEVVALGVLLPVDEVFRRRHTHRIGQDARSTMRRRPQPNALW